MVPRHDVRRGEKTVGQVDTVDFWYRVRFPLMAAGMLSLLFGIWAGLLRFGWAFPSPLPYLAGMHGPLMVSGFVGTVIGIERAVALGKPWGYAAPFFTALGAVALLANGETAGIAFLLMGSSWLLTIYLVILRKQFEMFNVTMALGALAWLVGNALWISGNPVHGFVLWWAGFLVLTIAGERLELSRFMEPSRPARMMFSASLGLLLAGLVLSSLAPEQGIKLAGIGMLAVALWLARYDIARRTVLQQGLTRFVAVCLLLGYFWLGFGGILLSLQAGLTPGNEYDAVLHSIFLGFAFSMIFGHAPIIFPAVLRLAVPYRPAFYLHLALLHLSLALRVVSDIGYMESLRMWGGLLNALALAAFLANTVLSIRKGLREPRA